MPKERIGLMGGSFNPIHVRHLEMAKEAMNELSLRKVLFVPTGNPPHKQGELAPAHHRYEMTRLAIHGMHGFEMSDVEINRDGVIYTVDTLALLHKQYTDAEFYYIIGEDTLYDLKNWRNPDKVFALCRFAVVCRENEVQAILQKSIIRQLQRKGAKFDFLHLPPKDVSATDIRKEVEKGDVIPNVVPQVREYIRIMGLYGVPAMPTKGAKYYAKLKKALSEKRLVHSLLVSDTARILANIHHVDENDVATAALLHDCAKCMSLSAMQKYVRQEHIIVDKLSMQAPNLLHGTAGAVVAMHEYGIKAPNVLSAISCHTTGRIGMFPLDMIVFLADKIEPSRRSYPALEEVRILAKSDLSKAMICSLQSTLGYVKKQQQQPHPTTARVEAWLSRIDQHYQKERV